MSEQWKCNLPVPFFSQREVKYEWQRIARDGGENIETPNTAQGINAGPYNAGDNIGFPISLAHRACNIVSLCMILHYYGITNDTPDEMLRKFFDEVFPDARRQAPGDGMGFRKIEWGSNMLSFINVAYHVPRNYIEHRIGTSNIAEARDKIASGYPIWFSYGPLSSIGSGHIAVLRGFTEKGHAIINDPWGDPVNPFGNLRTQNNSPGLFYRLNSDDTGYFGLGTGDNVVIRRDQLERIMRGNALNRVFWQTLTIRYPHFWSFPIRTAQNERQQMNLPLGSNNTDIEKHQQNQSREMLRNEDIDNAGFPISTLGAWHDGIHIRGTEDTPVYAMGPGRLIAARTARLPENNAARNNNRDRTGERTSTCFALVQHFVKARENERSREFFSYYMHLKPVDVNTRLRERLQPQSGGNTERMASDWLDQVIGHVLPKKAIVAGVHREGNVFDGRQLYRWTNGSMKPINNGTPVLIAHSTLLRLYPICLHPPNDNDDFVNLDSPISNISADETPRDLRELYARLDNEETYNRRVTETVNGRAVEVIYYAFYYRESDNPNRYSVRYIRSTHIILQRLNVRQYAHYRKRLSSLVGGKAAIFLGDKERDANLPADNRRTHNQAFNECIRAAFPASQFPGLEFNPPGSNYLSEIDTVENWFRQNNAAMENRLETLYMHYLILVQKLLTYPEGWLNGSPFGLEVPTNWRNSLRNSLVRIFEREAYRLNQNEINGWNRDSLLEQFELEIGHFRPTNVDYHVEVNGNTKLGHMGAYAEIPRSPRNLIHYAVFAPEQIHENNTPYVVIEDDAIGPYIDCHTCVEKLRNANVLSVSFFKYLKYRIITERERRRFLRSPEAQNTHFIVLKHPNSFAFVSEQTINQTRQNAIGFIERNSSIQPDLSTYLETTWYTKEHERMAKKKVCIDKKGKVYSYHPVGFLKLLFNMNS